MLDGYFAEDPEGLVPRSHARGPWSEDMIHGRLFAALAAREVERRHLEGGLHIARVTADLFRATPMVPLTLRASRVRDGRRVRLVDVDVVADGRPAARVSVLLAAAQGAPPGRVWGLGSWGLLPPVGLEPPEAGRAEAAGYPQLHFESAGFGDTSEPVRAWLRDRWPLVDGEELTPAQRAVLASDLANPVSNWGDRGLHYINADITLEMVRAPQGEWIGLEVLDHLDSDGIAIGSCRVHDELGPLGQSNVVGMVYGSPMQPVAPPSASESGT